MSVQNVLDFERNPMFDVDPTRSAVEPSGAHIRMPSGRTMEWVALLLLLICFPVGCTPPGANRDDETEEAIQHRLEVYNEQTAPLVDFYRNEGLLLSVPTSDLDPVLAAIRERMQG